MKNSFSEDSFQQDQLTRKFSRKPQNTYFEETNKFPRNRQSNFESESIFQFQKLNSNVQQLFEKLKDLTFFVQQLSQSATMRNPPQPEPSSSLIQEIRNGLNIKIVEGLEELTKQVATRKETPTNVSVDMSHPNINVQEQNVNCQCTVYPQVNLQPVINCQPQSYVQCQPNIELKPNFELSPQISCQANVKCYPIIKLKPSIKADPIVNLTMSPAQITLPQMKPQYCINPVINLPELKPTIILQCSSNRKQTSLKDISKFVVCSTVNLSIKQPVKTYKTGYCQSSCSTVDSYAQVRIADPRKKKIKTKNIFNLVCRPQVNVLSRPTIKNPKPIIQNLIPKLQQSKIIIESPPPPSVIFRPTLRNIVKNYSDMPKPKIFIKNKIQASCAAKQKKKKRKYVSKEENRSQKTHQAKQLNIVGQLSMQCLPTSIMSINEIGQRWWLKCWDRMDVNGEAFRNQVRKKSTNKIQQLLENEGFALNYEQFQEIVSQAVDHPDSSYSDENSESIYEEEDFSYQIQS